MNGLKDKYNESISKDLPYVHSNYERDRYNRTPVCIIPGSFNPLHQAHTYIYHNVISCGAIPIFEISIKHRDKPDISFEDLVNRLRLLDQYNFIITRTPKIFQKIDVLSIVFNMPLEDIYVAMGSDVFEKFYSDEGRDAIFNSKSKFLVYNRNVGIHNVKYFEMPNHLNGISSSQLRSSNEQNTA